MLIIKQFIKILAIQVYTSAHLMMIFRGLRCKKSNNESILGISVIFALVLEFSKKWISFIKGTVDYLGLNYYTSRLVSPDPAEALGIYNFENGLKESTNSSWPRTNFPRFPSTPAGFGDILRRIRDKYDNPPVRIIENGYADDGKLEDYDRIGFHYDYLTEMLKAVKQDNCSVKSYSIWNALDDFEWTLGYTPEFGIIGVDFNDTDRPRTLKRSAFWWRSVINSHKLQPVPSISDP